MGFVKRVAAMLAALVMSMPLLAGVNLNTATAEELESLKGIGPSTAAKIIEYRNEHRFNSIEDIMNVKGVGEKTFLQIKDELEV
uniref:ComEA family DNA-binding protein n=1 Tax=Thiomicrolovo zhangzhouensis TaxID=3131933 RepID=UPI003F60E559